MGEVSKDGFPALTPVDLLGPLNEIETRYVPKALFIQGDRGLLKGGPRVAIIGARRVSPEGARRAKRLAWMLAERGVTIVSGLAEGVDTAAHKGAIEAGGHTVTVIGTPLDKSYPASNRSLQTFLAESHLVISQFASGTPVQPRNFPQRNRTMALISHASVIVEATETSGSLSQGWEALRLGRPLFLVRSIFENPDLKWPAKMREYGAEVLTDVDDVLDRIPSGNLTDLCDAAF